MKKIIVALLTVLLVFAFCGCENTSECENTSRNETSLNNVHMTKCYDNSTIVVYRHDETGVYYLGGASFRSGWCVMVNADGTPYTGE
ncbi:MAG: hypothetical protein II453_02790 [Alphaproteobacteria bacterium]|nr:hypothetical protein [Alphaproteobacteria bacterium]